MSTNSYDSFTEYPSVDEGGDDSGNSLGAPAPHPWAQEDNDVTADPVFVERHPLTNDHCHALFKTKQGQPLIGGNNCNDCQREIHKKETPTGGERGFYSALGPLTKHSKVDGDVTIYRDQPFSDIYRYKPFSGMQADLQEGERVKQNFLSGSFFGGSSPTDTHDPKLKALESAIKAAEDRLRYCNNMNLTTGEMNVPYRTTRDQVRAIEKWLALLQSQLDEYKFTHATKEEENRLQQTVCESYQGDATPKATPCSTVHDHPKVSIVKACWRSVKEASAKQDLETSQEANNQAARINAPTNQIAYQENQVAMNKRNARTTTSTEGRRRCAAGPNIYAGTAQDPRDLSIDPTSAGVATDQQTVASLQEQRADLEATLKRGPLLMAKESPSRAAPVRHGARLSALTANLTNLTSKFGTTATRVGFPVVPEEPITARLAEMQAKCDELEARLTEPEHLDRHQPASSPVVEAALEVMTKKVADLEYQLQCRAAAMQRQPYTSDPSPSDLRIAELEATVQRLTSALAGPSSAVAVLDDDRPPSENILGHGQEQSRSEPGEAAVHVVPPTLATATGTCHFMFDDNSPASKEQSTGADVVFRISIRVPKDVLDMLCLKEMPDTPKAQIAEAGLDVASLQGKYSASDVTDLHLKTANSKGHVIVMEQLVWDPNNSLRSRDLGYQSQKSATQPSTNKCVLAATKPKTCRRCGSKLHPNQTRCPLYHVDVHKAIARQLAVECQSASDFVAAAKAALIKHLADVSSTSTQATVN